MGHFSLHDGKKGFWPGIEMSKTRVDFLFPIVKKTTSPRTGLTTDGWTKEGRKEGVNSLSSFSSCCGSGCRVDSSVKAAAAAPLLADKLTETSIFFEVQFTQFCFSPRSFLPVWKKRCLVFPTGSR